MSAPVAARRDGAVLRLSLNRPESSDLLLRLVRIETLLQAVHHAPIPTMAVVRGAAMGAGADLVAACRRRVVVGSGRFAFPGAGFGIALGTRRLAGRVGPDRALDIVAGGRRLDQDEALAVGLIDAVIPEDAVDAEIARVAATAERLEAGVLATVAGLTLEDGRERDMAALVASASRPGLKDRVVRYQEDVRRARDERGR